MGEDQIKETEQKDEQDKDKATADALGESFLSTESIPKEMPSSFQTKIIDLDNIVYEGEAKVLRFNTPLGELAILSGHTPLFIQLLAGKIVIEETGGKKQEIENRGGIARINQSQATILVGFTGTEDEAKENSEKSSPEDKNKEAK